MTIKMPDPTVGDKILKFFGKKRGVILPSEPYEKYGPYAYSKALKENFWKALLRSRNAPLPENVVDLDLFKEEINRG
jgi:hypothetical protein